MNDEQVLKTLMILNKILAIMSAVSGLFNALGRFYADAFFDVLFSMLTYFLYKKYKTALDCAKSEDINK